MVTQRQHILVFVTRISTYPRFTNNTFLLALLFLLVLPLLAFPHSLLPFSLPQNMPPTKEVTENPECKTGRQRKAANDGPVYPPIFYDSHSWVEGVYLTDFYKGGREEILSAKGGVS